MKLRNGKKIINNEQFKNVKKIKTNPILNAITKRYGIYNIHHILKNNKNMNINIPNEDGDSPLILATKQKRSLAVKVLVHQKNINIYAKNKYNRSAFSYCADDKNSDIYKTILSKIKCDLNKYYWLKNNWSLNQISNKTKLFDDVEDDMNHREYETEFISNTEYY